jgi:hypothetical protein
MCFSFFFWFNVFRFSSCCVVFLRFSSIFFAMCRFVNLLILLVFCCCCCCLSYWPIRSFDHYLSRDLVKLVLLGTVNCNLKTRCIHLFSGARRGDVTCTRRRTNSFATSSKYSGRARWCGATSFQDYLEQNLTHLSGVLFEQMTNQYSIKI